MLRRFTQFSSAPAVMSSTVAAAAASSAFIQVASQRHSSTSKKPKLSPEQLVAEELRSFLYTEDPLLKYARELTDAKAKLDAARNANDCEALVSELRAAVDQVKPTALELGFDFKRGSHGKSPIEQCAHLCALLRAIHVADRHITNLSSELEIFVVEHETRPAPDLRACARTLIKHKRVLEAATQEKDGGEMLVRQLTFLLENDGPSFDFTRGREMHPSPDKACQHLDGLLKVIFNVDDEN